MKFKTTHAPPGDTLVHQVSTHTPPGDTLVHQVSKCKKIYLFITFWQVNFCSEVVLIKDCRKCYQI